MDDRRRTGRGERARQGSWRNERPMWRCNARHLVSVDPSWGSGDLAPNRPVGMQKSGAQRANRTTKPPRAAAHGSIALRQPTATLKNP